MADTAEHRKRFRGKGPRASAGAGEDHVASG